MTDEEMREFLRNLNYLGVPMKQMASDIDVVQNTIKRLISEQTTWVMQQKTREKVEKYIEWVKNTLNC